MKAEVEWGGKGRGGVGIENGGHRILISACYGLPAEEGGLSLGV